MRKTRHRWMCITHYAPYKVESLISAESGWVTADAFVFVFRKRKTRFRTVLSFRWWHQKREQQQNIITVSYKASWNPFPSSTRRLSLTDKKKPGRLVFLGRVEATFDLNILVLMYGRGQSTSQGILGLSRAFLFKYITRSFSVGARSVNGSKDIGCVNANFWP